MPTHALALMGSVLLSAAPALAANEYTIWSSVIFARTGERTPRHGLQYPPTLTSLGATQSYNAGSFFRQRYLTGGAGDPNGLTVAPIAGLSQRVVNDQIYVLAADTEWTAASAQAFMQGMYPPTELNTSAASTLDGTAILANDTYIDYPLSGFQYTQISTAGRLDAASPSIAGTIDCRALGNLALTYTDSEEYKSTNAASAPIYSAVASVLQDGAMTAMPWDYFYAYDVYDYLAYQNAHNSTANALLKSKELVDVSANTSYLDQLRWLADESEFAMLGDLTATNTYTSAASPWSADGVRGSISTISGNMLAAKMLDLLQSAVNADGAWYKFNLLVGDFEPLLSLFALLKLSDQNDNFKAIPEFGSALVFELFSQSDGNASTTFPSSDELFVRAYFRNGTESHPEAVDDGYQAYPLFGFGPSNTDLSWSDFQGQMQGIALGELKDWCLQCGASNIFCAQWMDEEDGSEGQDASWWARHHHDRERKGGLKPAVAGVVGAIVALCIAGLIFAALMLLAGVRFHRVERQRNSKKSDLGGFKGSRKMASDKDLVLPGGAGAMGAGASVERGHGHERVGSWEMKHGGDGEADASGLRAPDMLHIPSQNSARPSFEITDDPFRDPVRPRESF